MEEFNNCKRKINILTDWNILNKNGKIEKLKLNDIITKLKDEGFKQILISDKKIKALAIQLRNNNFSSYEEAEKNRFFVDVKNCKLYKIVEKNSEFQEEEKFEFLNHAENCLLNEIDKENNLQKKKIKKRKKKKAGDHFYKFKNKNKFCNNNKICEDNLINDDKNFKIQKKKNIVDKDSLFWDIMNIK